MNDGATVEVDGSAGWGLAEGMLSGTVTARERGQRRGRLDPRRHRGGPRRLRGAGRRGHEGRHAPRRRRVGYMTGFMMQKGTIVVCGDAGEALADSMYEGVVFVGGEIASLGNDAVIEVPSEEDQRRLTTTLAEHGLAGQRAFRKVVSGRKLWNFDPPRARYLAVRAVTDHDVRELPVLRQSPRLHARRHRGDPGQGRAGPVPHPRLRHAPRRGRCPAFDDLTFLPASLTRIPLEGYRERCRRRPCWARASRSSRSSSRSR